MTKCATATTSSLPNKLADSDNTGPKQGSISVPNRLHGRALKEHVALIPKSVHVTVRAVAQSPSTAMAPTQDIWETVSPHPETHECTQATSTERVKLSLSLVHQVHVPLHPAQLLYSSLNSSDSCYTIESEF